MLSNAIQSPLARKTMKAKMKLEEENKVMYQKAATFVVILLQQLID